MPGAALANTGTALMHLTLLDLVLGNAVIGWLEALLLRRLAGPSGRSMVRWLIAANYISWIGGRILLIRIMPGPITILNFQVMLPAVIAEAFLLTLVMEAPIVWLLLSPERRSPLKVLRYTLVFNVASYSLLIPFYWAASDLTLIRDMDIQPNLDFVRNRGAILYYVDREPQTLMRRPLTGGEAEPLEAPRADEAAAHSIRDGYTRFSVCRTTDTVSIYFIPDIGSFPPSEDPWELARDIPIHSSEAELPLCTVEELLQRRWPLYPAADLRPEGSSSFLFESYVWPAGGFIIQGPKEGGGGYYGVETPISWWGVRSLTVLPGDEVVFQLGSQICIYQHPTRKLGLVGFGHSPLAVP